MCASHRSRHTRAPSRRDPARCRDLRVAGTEATARELCAAASEATGHTFHLFRAGSADRLDLLSRVVRRIAPEEGEVFPAWQGMQYLRDMFDGDVKLEPLDNDRYRDIRWTRVRDRLGREVEAAARPAPVGQPQPG